MDEIKVGIIGSGFIADHHCYSLSLLPNVEIVGIASNNKEEANSLLKKYGTSLLDCKRMTTYIREYNDIDFVKPYLMNRFPNMKFNFIHTSICRPEWLIESECSIIKEK